MAAQPPATILLVDDEAINRHAFGWWLSQAGYRVLEAENGSQALRLADENPDLVILDLNLPDISGFEVCQRLQARPATRHVALLFITAVYVAADDRMQGLEQGADAYLVKPVQQRELLAHVRALLRARMAEEACRHAAQQWRTTFDAITDPVCLVDCDNRVLRCNRALMELSGQDYDAVIGQPLAVVLRKGLKLDADPPITPVCAAHQQVSAEVPFGPRWFRISADPIFDVEGRCAGGVHILTDITDRKRLEEQVRQSQRLEAIGRLAGGVAHDFNNLLTAILGSASLLQRGSPRSEYELNLVGTIERSAWRAAELTRQLLGFSRQTLLWLRVADPREIFEETERNLRRLMEGTGEPATRPSAAELEVGCQPGLWLVHADPGQIAQVLLHLCQNALDAMPQGGRLRLEVANAELTEETAHHPEARAGSFVRFRVEDTGTGIPPDVLDKIFDPFFTTKPIGRGTGLGLAMVHGIIKQHQGWVECLSPVPHPGRDPAGTRFDIYIPRTGAQTEPQAPARPARTAAPGGSRLVLLADDNETLRHLAATYLQQGGFQVLQAGDGKEALDLYRQEHQRIDLVILDHMMPQMTGKEAVAQMRQINPAVRVLLATGSLTGTATDERVAGIILKPYRERELLEAVYKALEMAEAVS